MIDANRPKGKLGQQGCFDTYKTYIITAKRSKTSKAMRSNKIAIFGLDIKR